MGYQNVGRILLAVPPVPLPRATVHCLLLMAWTAHDRRPEYFAGQSWLALQMGYPPGPDGKRIIRRHIQVLKKHGYVSETGRMRKGHAVYSLHLPSMGEG